MLIDNALAQLTGAILIPVSCANILIARYLSATAIAPSETPALAIAPSETPATAIAPSETPALAIAPSKTPALATAPPQMLPTTPALATAPQSLHFFFDLVQRFGTSGCYLCSNKKN